MDYFLMLGAEMAPISWLAFLLLCMVMLWFARRKYRVKKRWVFGGMLLNNLSAIAMYYCCLRIFGYSEVKLKDDGVNLFVFMFWPFISGFLVCLAFLTWKGVFMRDSSTNETLIPKSAMKTAEIVSQEENKTTQLGLENGGCNRKVMIRLIGVFVAVLLCITLLRRVNTKIERLENRIEYLDSQVNSLESEIEDLKSEVDNIEYYK